MTDKTHKPDKSNNDLKFTQEDIEELQKQGIQIHDIQKIAEEVDEQLSDNANKPDDNDTADDTDDNQGNTKNKQNDERENLPDTPTLPSDNHNNNYHGLVELTDNQIRLDDKITQNHEAIENLKQEQQKDQERQFDTLKSYIAQKQNKQEIDYKNVRLTIEAGAHPSFIYYVMNGLSAVIAGFGLLLNSPAVVIGAMLVAMMLSPITGIALALIDYRFSLVKKSLFTLVTGGLLIYAIGLVLGFLYPENSMTSEIVGRTSPNTMDLIIALAGGTAGAYAMISPKLSVAVVGVAVATALVPPLTASAILLANGRFELAWGAFLLTLTNILAIQFTNALVLWWAGFRRLGLDNDDSPKSHLAQMWLFIQRNVVTLLLHYCYIFWRNWVSALDDGTN